LLEERKKKFAVAQNDVSLDDEILKNKKIHKFHHKFTRGGRLQTRPYEHRR
jgi:hypothetical protein